jgi:hypothetical protein
MVDEDAFVGHAAGLSTSRLAEPPLPDDALMNPGGLAGVWAEENSRDALFEAMRRRETWGTSGPRIVVRFFGGFELPEDLCATPDLAARGYAHGVPMGADLRPRPEPRRRASYSRRCEIRGRRRSPARACSVCRS